MFQVGSTVQVSQVSHLLKFFIIIIIIKWIVWHMFQRGSIASCLKLNMWHMYKRGSTRFCLVWNTSHIFQTSSTAKLSRGWIIQMNSSLISSISRHQIDWRVSIVIDIDKQLLTVISGANVRHIQWLTKYSLCHLALMKRAVVGDINLQTVLCALGFFLDVVMQLPYERTF